MTRRRKPVKVRYLSKKGGEGVMPRQTKARKALALVTVTSYRLWVRRLATGDWLATGTSYKLLAPGNSKLANS